MVGIPGYGREVYHGGYTRVITVVSVPEYVSLGGYITVVYIRVCLTG